MLFTPSAIRWYKSNQSQFLLFDSYIVKLNEEKYIVEWLLSLSFYALVAQVRNYREL